MRVITIDLETSISTGPHGPDAKDPSNDAYTFIYGDHPDNVIIEHNKDGFSRVMPSRCADMLVESDILVGHNLGFDLRYLWGNKSVIDYLANGKKLWCTQVAEYILTGQQHAFSSLAELQEKYFGAKEKPNRISKLYKKGIGADVIIAAKRRCRRLFALYETYCYSDGNSALRIFKEQYKRAKANNMLPIVELYQDYLAALTCVSMSGIKIDTEQAELLLREFNLKHLEHLDNAQKILSGVWEDSRLPEFNVNSGDHKSAALFGGKIKVVNRQQCGYFKNGNERFRNVEDFIEVKGLGLPKSLTYLTKKEGVYATGTDVIEKITNANVKDSAKKYCEHQKEAMMYKKAANTYVRSFLELSVNGYIYPHFNNTLTSTGRLSSSKPNMQNISKRNKFGKDLHKLLVAPDGWTCVSIDFSQLEIWVMGWLSNDPLLCQHLQDGTDMHIVRLGYYNDKNYDELYKLCKIDNDPHWQHQRTLAKTVSYQMAYGAGANKVAESTGLPLDVVKKIYEKEAETYPETSKLSENVLDSVEKTATFSKNIDIPAALKKGINGAHTFGSVELMPTFDKQGNVHYTNNEFRRVGYYTSKTGKKYHFLDSAKDYGRGVTKRQFSFTQAKNYIMQGSAADIQAATTAALLRALLTRPDKIKMINEVHDSKWFYVRTDCLDDVLPWLRKVIEDVPKIFKERFNITVPFKFPVDIEVGKNFAEMEKYNDRR